MRGYRQIQSAILVLAVLVGAAVAGNSAGRETSEEVGNMRGDELYAALRSIMEDRYELWFAPPPDTNRDINVSSIVCPLVDDDKLLELQRNGSYGINSIVLQNDPVAPPGTRLWTIPGKSSFLEIEELSIWIGTEYCLAQYRLTK